LRSRCPVFRSDRGWLASVAQAGTGRLGCRPRRTTGQRRAATRRSNDLIRLAVAATARACRRSALARMPRSSRPTRPASRGRSYSSVMAELRPCPSLGGAHDRKKGETPVRSDETTGPTVGPVRLRSGCLCAFPARRLCVALFGSGSLAAGPAPTSLLRSGGRNENFATSRGCIPIYRTGRGCVARTATHEQYEAGSGDESKHRHRAAGCGRREHQFEERDRITRTRLEWPERAVSVVRGDARPLGHECADGEP
jgi:hypothetical protein